MIQKEKILTTTVKPQVAPQGPRLRVPALARAIAQRKTVFVNPKTVHVSYRNPEFFSDSPISILNQIINMKGGEDELVNPDAVSADIASGAFSISLSSSKIQRIFGVKVTISGNTNINTAARVDATLRAKSANNVNQDVKVQLNLKAFSVDFYHFFAKTISQVVEPMIINQGQFNLTVATVDGNAGTIGFQQLATYTGTGPNNLTIQVEPLSSRHPDVMNLTKNLGQVRRFLALMEKKYRYICDSDDLAMADSDDVTHLFDPEDVRMYDLGD